MPRPFQYYAVLSVVLSFGFIVYGCKVQKGNLAYDTSSEYLEARNKLIDDYNNQSISSGIKLSQDELRLEEHFRQIQNELLDHYKNTHYFPPARNFYGSKEHVESSELFSIISQMPKGGALHIHTAAMGDLDWIIEKAKDLRDMYIYWSDTNKIKKGSLKAFNPNNVPLGYIPVHAVLSNESRLEEFKSYFLFDQSIDRDSVDIWGQFENIFGRLHGFVNYEEVFEDYVHHGLQLLADDGVQHVELRMPFENHMYNKVSPPNVNNIEPFVNAMNNALDRVRISYPDFTIKVIHANLRFKPNEAIWVDMQKVHKNRQQYPKLLTGYDLVAEEDAGHPTLYHLESFLKLKELNTQSQHKLDSYLHNGESDWVDNTNLFDAVLLGSKRIGHGFNLFRYPGLMKLAKRNNTCIEVNPLSNQILGYVRDLRMHPAYNYMRDGVQITISSDDPLFFGYKGLSYDYWHIYMAWQLSLKDLKKLSKNGIIYSSLTVQEKEIALKNWERRWESFVYDALKKLSG